MIWPPRQVARSRLLTLVTAAQGSLCFHLGGVFVRVEVLHAGTREMHACLPTPEQSPLQCVGSLWTDLKIPTASAPRPRRVAEPASLGPWRKLAC